MIALLIATIRDESDRSFFEDLYNQYKKLMYSVIHGITHDAWATEDVMQTTIVKLIDKIERLRTLDENKCLNYIITASKNTALNHIRGNKRIKYVPIEDFADAPDGMINGLDDEIIHKELIDGVYDVYQDLDPKTKRILELKYILEANDSEIAEELGVQPASVRMALTRARGKLKAKIKKANLD